jgi:hypothetical protein
VSSGAVVTERWDDRNSGENTCPSVTLPSSSLTYTEMGSNTELRGQMSASDGVGHGKSLILRLKNVLCT